MAYARKLLEEIGLEGERLQMVNISSAQAGQFAEYAKEITEKAKELGPSPLKEHTSPVEG